VRSATAADGTFGIPLRLAHAADLGWLRVLRRRVGRWAAEHQIPDEALIDLQLVLGEAVSNGVEHAYRHGSRGTVEVELQLQDVGDPVVAVRVVDHGRWRPIPMRKDGRGRGLAIIDRLSRGLQISASAAGTALTCAVPLRRSGAPGRSPSA
jgi:anti-sigma regulatory factor (Ser/Thr protein kinase)